MQRERETERDAGKASRYHVGCECTAALSSHGSTTPLVLERLGERACGPLGWDTKRGRSCSEPRTAKAEKQDEQRGATKYISCRVQEVH